MQLCERQFSDLYGPLLHLGKRSEEIIRLLASTPADLEDLQALLAEGWREHLVGAVSALFHPQPEACRRLLWEAFDRNSWVTPQLAFCALMLDPGDLEEARRRLLLRCPVWSAHLEGTDPMVRHVVHGSAAIQKHSMKGMAALLATCARDPAGRAWMADHVPLADAFWALEVDVWDHGDELARTWGDEARAILTRMAHPIPAWLDQDVPERLLSLWDLAGHPAPVRLLCSLDWPSRLERLFHTLMQKGPRSFLLEGDERRGRLLGRGPGGNEVLLELPGPYLIPGLWDNLVARVAGNDVLVLGDGGGSPPALKVTSGEGRLEIAVLEDYLPLRTSFEIVADRLEDCQADVWVLGIDSRGSLDGGVAAAVARAAGEGYQESLREGLARGARQPGEVVVTPGFALERQGVRLLAHVVTVPRPTRDELARALQRVLEYASRYSKGHVALPALGCGAAGFRAEEVAVPLLEVVANWQGRLFVTLSAPRVADREAFARAARALGLGR